MQLSQDSQCYCCEKTATTTEHIPPRCFFPEKKYLPNNSPDYRKNLVTVPSCSEHNNSRSKDDQYTAAVITMNSANNDIGFAIYKSKWLDTMCRRDASLGKRIFSTAREVRVISKKDSLLIPSQTLAISYEMERIENVIKSIVHGLYYLEFQRKWINDIDIISPNFLQNDLNHTPDIHKLKQMNQYFIDLQEHQQYGLEKKGSHFDIFYYQFLKGTTENCHTIRMVFYNHFIFFAILKNSIFKV